MSATPSQPVAASRFSTMPGAISGGSIGGGVIFVIFGSIFMAIGWTIGARQQYRLATYLPVPARVISSRIVQHRGRHGVTDEPVVTYAYSVDSVRHQANQASPAGRISSSIDWAEEVVARYPTGTTTTAWYSPSDPSSAFLLREANMLPYIFALFPAIFFGLGLYLIVSTLHAARPIAPLTPASSGWFRVAEEGTLRGRIRINAVASIALYAYAGLVIGDYFYLNRQFDPFFFVASGSVVAASLIFLIPLRRNWTLSHDFLGADLQISQDRIHLGDAIQLRLRQDLARLLEVDQMSLGVVCIRYDRLQNPGGRGMNYISAEAWSQWRDLEVDRTYQAGGHLDLQGHFTIPPQASPSSPPRSRDYPIYRWRIALGIIAKDQPKLAVCFPITIEPAQ